MTTPPPPQSPPPPSPHAANPREAEVEAIFHEALELPHDQRGRFIQQATDNDPQLRDEVDSLLAAHARAGAFLSGHALHEAAHAEPFIDPMIGRTLGNYRIIDRLGSGGMGSVYLAERADDAYQQRVAIKLIKRHAAGDEILSRFHNERQALANLNHPNIARLLDGGTTAGHDAQPYLVMEFVEGKRLDEHADERRLTIPQRLELFRTVCEAVQAAHRSLIVHRDLKPSNILVTDDGTVKLLDFGIAKMLAPAPDDPTRPHTPADVTATIERRMTPAYASPEQVRGLPITTATDVYSLGVVLYELLTGHRPHRIVGASFDQASKAICEQPAPRPSTAALQPIEGIHATDPITGRLTTTITPEQIARRRGTDPARLQRILQGDLENIILMALRKEPERRYSTVEQFTQDLNRYRQRLPVIARRDTLAYRLTRFTQRNALAVSAAAACIALLLTTTFMIAIALARAIDAEQMAAARLTESQRAQAEEAEQRAEAVSQRRIAEAINQFLIDDLLLAVSPEVTHPADVTITEVIDRAAGVIDQRFSDLPIVEAEVRATLGNAYRILGQYERATPLLLQAIELLTNELGRGDLRTIRAQNSYAVMQYEMGELNDAEQALRTAFILAEQHLGPDSIDTLTAQSALCSVLMELQRYDEASQVCLDMLQTARAAHGNDHRITNLALNYAGRLHMELEQLDEAADIFRSLYESRQRTEGSDAVSTNSALNNLAVLYIRMERFADAEPLLRRALLHYQHALGQTHVRTLTLRGNLGRSIFEQGRHAEAEPILRETVAHLLEQLGDTHWIPAAFMSIHGSCLAALNRFEEAESTLIQSHTTVLNALGPNHDRTRAIQQRITDLYTNWLTHTPDNPTITTRAAAWRALLTNLEPANN